MLILGPDRIGLRQSAIQVNSTDWTRCVIVVPATTTRDSADRNMTLVEHFEKVLGPIHTGWELDPDEKPMPFQIVRFAGGSDAHSVGYATLGLSRYPLSSPTSGRPIRQELLMLVSDALSPDRILSLLLQVGSAALGAGRALLRGDVIGPAGALVPGSDSDSALRHDARPFSGRVRDVRRGRWGRRHRLVGADQYARGGLRFPTWLGSFRGQARRTRSRPCRSCSIRDASVVHRPMSVRLCNRTDLDEVAGKAADHPRFLIRPPTGPSGSPTGALSR